MLQMLLSARRRLGLTQVEMAKKLGISRNYLALIETGKRRVPPSVSGAIVTIQGDIVTEESASIPDDCPLCAGKDAELAGLREEIKEARAVIRDLSSSLAALAAKPTVPRVIPASGAGVGGHKERRGA